MGLYANNSKSIPSKTPFSLILKTNIGFLIKPKIPQANQKNPSLTATGMWNLITWVCWRPGQHQPEAFRFYSVLTVQSVHFLIRELQDQKCTSPIRACVMHYNCVFTCLQIPGRKGRSPPRSPVCPAPSPGLAHTAASKNIPNLLQRETG